MTAVNLSAYLARIGYTGPLDASLETLAALHWQHVNRIPFENLNPLMGQPVSLALRDLEKKLVMQQRGGYCHEHALLFAQVLRQLGFSVRPLLARVLWGQPEDARTAASHLLLCVTLAGEDYLVDTAFGALTGVAPLRLHDTALQLTRHETFRLRTDNDLCTLEALEHGQWRAMYRFALHTAWPADYEMANWYTACHPSSPFVSQLMASRVDGTVRHILHNDRYTRRHADGRIERHLLGSAEAVVALLEAMMDIRLPDRPGLTQRLGDLLRQQLSARLTADARDLNRSFIQATET
ncbi:arylamine N-acetyltransferase family protein [Isoalcanivorax indicus]|uniref:arylamine N-acetyltransferase family protein n=1 Tax=Isoalcanivorax indicus TaxID=2202653 RepID=UPI000DBA5F39|nr:arylamine N-acetyltransferase [Isoalcanivorax indicus]